MKMIKKANLPSKVCIHCQRPFTWRKKWEKVWDEVKYCSDRCRMSYKGGKTQLLLPEKSLKISKTLSLL